MAFYDYFCNIHKEFEAEHSITEELKECPKCKEEGIQSEQPKKLISKSNFILVGGGWGKDNYK